MDAARTVKHDFETVAWGALFIWWGIADSDIGLFKFLPHGIGWAGIGLILLGLNAARARNGIPMGSLTTTLGIIALVLGGVELAGSVFGLPFEIPGLAVVLITLGLVVLARELLRIRKDNTLSEKTGVS
ncbi:MAG: hypothetical protein WCF84_17170 [Anaerolineae bacterium]